MDNMASLLLMWGQELCHLVRRALEHLLYTRLLLRDNPGYECLATAGRCGPNLEVCSRPSVTVLLTLQTLDNLLGSGGSFTYGHGRSVTASPYR